MVDNLLDPQQSQTNYFEQLVGENKRFKTGDDLARSKDESDAYVKTLESRLDELREDYLNLRQDYTSRAKLEDVIDQFQQTPNQRLASSDTPQAKEVRDKPFDPNEIRNLVNTQLQEIEMSKKQRENYEIVRNKLQERYGENYQNVLKQQLEALDITEVELNDMARKQPKVLFKTLGIDEPPQRQSFFAPPQSNVKADSFKPVVKERTWSYYQDMKKENPKLYWDPKTTVQMHNDYARLGNRFEDGDFTAL